MKKKNPQFRKSSQRPKKRSRMLFNLTTLPKALSRLKPRPSPANQARHRQKLKKLKVP